jgi:hypothetical protein
LAERKELVLLARAVLEAEPADARSEEAAQAAFLALARRIAGRLGTRLTSGHFRRGVQ